MSGIVITVIDVVVSTVLVVAKTVGKFIFDAVVFLLSFVMPILRAIGIALITLFEILVIAIRAIGSFFLTILLGIFSFFKFIFRFSNRMVDQDSRRIYIREKV